MIVVECYSDKYFINRLIPREKVIHGFCKGNVLNIVNNMTNVVGLIDADPNDSQPRSLRNYIRNQKTNGITILTKIGNNSNKLIELDPRFEAWIIERANQNGLSLGDFNLPSTARDLHSIKRIDLDPRYHRFVDSLIGRDPILERIRSVVSEVAE